jgi:hypothetical protein
MGRADFKPETGLRLLTRRALRVPTPLRGSWRELWSFGRRQGQFVRLYRPRLWCCASLIATADFLARVVLAWHLLAEGSPPALRVLALVAALGSVVTEFRRAVGRRISTFTIVANSSVIGGSHRICSIDAPRSANCRV